MIICLLSMSLADCKALIVVRMRLNRVSYFVFSI